MYVAVIVTVLLMLVVLSIFQMRMHRNNKPVATHEHYKVGEDRLPKNFL